jgi:S1-C subfamily serine protease
MTLASERDVPSLISAIKDASRRFRRSALVHSLRELMACISSGRATASVAQAKEVIDALRDDRRFAEMKMLADLFIRTGTDSARLRTRYAQALIETGEYVPAIDLLERLRAAETSINAVLMTSEAPELSEVDGLIGRAWKDIALQNLGSGNLGLAARALNAAYAAYRRGLMLNPDERSSLIWHGINLAGIQAVARQHRIALAAPEPIEVLAARILDAVKRAELTEELDPWDIASAAEACIALGRFEEAKNWFARYLKHPKLKGFMLGSTIRQMGAIWDLSATPQGAEILQLLVRFQLGRQDPGSEAVLSPDQMAAIESLGDARSRSSYQSAKPDEETRSAQGDGRPMPLDELMTALARAKSIGLIRRNFEALGTGFVTTRKELGLVPCADQDDRVIVTNSHVVSKPPDRDLSRNVDAAPPEETTITFTYPPEGSGKAYRIERVEWNSPYLKHDVSVLIPKDPLGKDIDPLSLAAWPPHQLPEKAYIVGHPLGQTISFAFDNNRIEHIEIYSDDGEAKRIYYGTPTSPGNSGSPVFNERWDVIGIHHMGAVRVPEKSNVANEGILAASVCSAIRMAKCVPGDTKKSRQKPSSKRR